MNEELLFATGMIRFIVYVIVATMSIFCLAQKECPDRVLHVGDLLFCIVSSISFLTQNIAHLPLGFASIYIFTPAFFIWGLSRVIYFNKNHGQKKTGFNG